MDAIMFVLAGVEAHPVLTQAFAIIGGASIALYAANRALRGVREQIERTLASEKIARAHEKLMIYSAFAADLDALKKQLTGFHDALVDDAELEKRGIFKSVFLASRNVVWESCAPKIGVLEPNQAANIIETYRFIDGLVGRTRALDLENEDHRKDLAFLISDAIKQIDRVLGCLPFRPDRENTGPE